MGNACMVVFFPPLPLAGELPDLQPQPHPQVPPNISTFLLHKPYAVLLQHTMAARLQAGELPVQSKLQDMHTTTTLDGWDGQGNDELLACSAF
ncbi:hypothetical protein BRADI_1g59408v3 [Brachypodium distachyon]|uniref:Uncharacterized protein n=1 Tax=Brachypodium distachyon TaxID=15368 RepID=A0A2K2DSG1_BRADI|nr:hypothetical protein BRADI_1g59408v3 [Brachypodium distachyon]